MSDELRMNKPRPALTCMYETIRLSSETVLPVPEGISSTQWPCSSARTTSIDHKEAHPGIKCLLQVAHVRVLLWSWLGGPRSVTHLDTACMRQLPSLLYEVVNSPLVWEQDRQVIDHKLHAGPRALRCEGCCAARQVLAPLFLSCCCHLFSPV